jgi:regulatory protein
MKEIDEDVYRKTLADLAQKKFDSLKDEQYLLRKKKTTDFLLQKGYEPELISAVINSFGKAE